MSRRRNRSPYRNDRGSRNDFLRGLIDDYRRGSGGHTATTLIKEISKNFMDADQEVEFLIIAKQDVSDSFFRGLVDKRLFEILSVTAGKDERHEVGKRILRELPDEFVVMKLLRKVNTMENRTHLLEEENRELKNANTKIKSELRMELDEMKREIEKLKNQVPTGKPGPPQNEPRSRGISREERKGRRAGISRSPPRSRSIKLGGGDRLEDDFVKYGRNDGPSRNARNPPNRRQRERSPPRKSSKGPGRRQIDDELEKQRLELEAEFGLGGKSSSSRPVGRSVYSRPEPTPPRRYNHDKTRERPNLVPINALSEEEPRRRERREGRRPRVEEKPKMKMRTKEEQLVVRDIDPVPADRKLKKSAEKIPLIPRLLLRFSGSPPFPPKELIEDCFRQWKSTPTGILYNRKLGSGEISTGNIGIAEQTLEWCDMRIIEGRVMNLYWKTDRVIDNRFCVRILGTPEGTEEVDIKKNLFPMGFTFMDIRKLKPNGREFEIVFGSIANVRSALSKNGMSLKNQKIEVVRVPELEPNRRGMEERPPRDNRRREQPRREQPPRRDNRQNSRERGRRDGPPDNRGRPGNLNRSGRGSPPNTTTRSSPGPVARVSPKGGSGGDLVIRILVLDKGKVMKVDPILQFDVKDFFKTRMNEEFSNRLKFKSDGIYCEMKDLGEVFYCMENLDLQPLKKEIGKKKNDMPYISDIYCHPERPPSFDPSRFRIVLHLPSNVDRMKVKKVFLRQRLLVSDLRLAKRGHETIGFVEFVRDDVVPKVIKMRLRLWKKGKVIRCRMYRRDDDILFEKSK